MMGSGRIRQGWKATIDTGCSAVVVLSGLCIAAIAAGCVSSEQYYRDITLSREAAYRRWKHRQQMEKFAEVRIRGRLSLEDCLKLSLVYNKSLQRVMEEREIARGERLKSYSAILPSVGLSADYKRLDEVSSFTIASQKVTLGNLDNYSAALQVTQPIYAGGSIPARIHAARLFSLLTDQVVRQAVENVVYEVCRAYYDVLLNQQLVQISADAVRSAKAHLDDVRQKRRAGVASDFDVLRAEVELSNFRAELIQNRNAINLAKARLLKLMGVSQESEFVLSDELVYEPMEMTREQAVATAFRKRPELLRLEADVRYQQELLKVVASRYWPILSAYYQNTWAKPDPHNSMEIEWGHRWVVGVTATVPIFEGLSRYGELVQQKARLRQSQIDLVDAEETALFELTKALLSLESAAEFVESQRLNLSRAKEGLRLAELGYREGTNTQVEMIDAQAALTKARVLYYQAVHSHMMAKLELQKAMGVLADYGRDVGVQSGVSRGTDGSADGGERSEVTDRSALERVK